MSIQDRTRNGGRRRDGFTTGFVAGVLAVGALIGGGLSWIVSSYGEKIVGVLGEYAPAISGWSQEGAANAYDLSSGTWYMAVDYKDFGKDKDGNGEPIRVWVMKFKGNSNVTGTIATLDPSNTATGISSGYVRDRTLSLAYGSEDPGRRGYGSYMLARVDSSTAGQSAYYVGVAIVHSCLLGPDGVCGPGPRMECPAILSRQPKPSVEMKAKYLVPKCRVLDFPWPDRVAAKG